MKNKVIILILFFGLIYGKLGAQESLKVEYELVEPEENYNFSGLPPGIKIIIPIRYFELILNEKESIWKSIEKINNEQNEDKGAMVSRITFPPSGDFYKNVRDKIKVQEMESFSKKYLIKDSLKGYNWQITRETKEILGLQVQKATFTDEESGIELIAWYSPKVNFKNGPDEFWGLPGLILEVEAVRYFDDNSKRSRAYKATKLEILKSDKKIIPPAKGIVVTEEEFNQLQQEKFEKMRQMREQGVDKD